MPRAHVPPDGPSQPPFRNHPQTLLPSGSHPPCPTFQSWRATRRLSLLLTWAFTVSPMGMKKPTADEVRLAQKGLLSRRGVIYCRLMQGAYWQGGDPVSRIPPAQETGGLLVPSVRSTRFSARCGASWCGAGGNARGRASARVRRATETLLGSEASPLRCGTRSRSSRTGCFRRIATTCRCTRTRPSRCRGLKAGSRSCNRCKRSRDPRRGAT